MPRVFISYVRENSTEVQRLVHALEARGVDVWFDQTHLLPGDRWAEVIRREIAEGDFFLACFSTEYTSRTQGFVFEELTQAVEQMRQRPHDQRWFIPVLLSACEVPDHPIGAGETLRSIQWVTLYDNWDDGIQRLISVIEPNPFREAIHPVNIHFTEHAYYDPGRAVEFRAIVDEERVDCAISLDVLMDRFGADYYDPMLAFIANRQDIEQIANRLIKSRWLENNGTVLIRISDVIARS